MQALVSPAVQAAETPDEGLLEFLGSVDTEDKDWHDYLSRTDIDRVAQGAAPPVRANPPGQGQPAPPASPPPASPPPSSSVPPAGAPPLAGAPVGPR